MTGKELYAMYCEELKKHCPFVLNWPQIGDIDRATWNGLAARLDADMDDGK